MIKAEIKNFTKKELACRCGCGLYSYNDDFLIKLQAFRLILNEPLYPTSGCRCKRHNAYVGGVPNSLHEAETKPATAVDVTNSNVKHLYETAITSHIFNEVIFYKKEKFVHLGYDHNQLGNYFKIKE
jgi:hypothetical protein